MQIKTPKRYARRGRRHNLISVRSLLIWIIVPVLIFIGIGIYENREMFAPQVNELVGGLVDEAGNRIEDINAPPPTPTRDPSTDLQRASDAWARGSIQEAVNLYQRNIESLPNDLSTHYRLTFGLIMQGRLQEAVTAAENVVTADPFSADAWAIRSMALNRAGRNGEAVASAQRALEIATVSAVEENPELAPTRARAQAFLAEAYLNLGRTEIASTLVDQALETYPDSFEAYQIRGRVNQEVNFDLEAALADYRTAYELAPNLIYLGIWLARMERQGFQNYEAALDLYQDIAEQNPDNTQVLFELGDHYLRVEGNFTEAASYLSRCVNADSNNAACHYLLGRTMIQQERIIEALEVFQKAIELDPQNGYAYYWHAEANIRLGQCPQAMPYLQDGYQIAQDAEDDLLIESFVASLQQCGSTLVPTATPEPEITPEIEGNEA